MSNCFAAPSHLPAALLLTHLWWNDFPCLQTALTCCSKLWIRTPILLMIYPKRHFTALGQPAPTPTTDEGLPCCEPAYLLVDNSTVIYKTVFYSEIAPLLASPLMGLS